MYIGYRAYCANRTLFHYSLVERKDIVGLNKLSSVLFEGSETVANTGRRCRNSQGLGIHANDAGPTHFITASRIGSSKG